MSKGRTIGERYQVAMGMTDRSEAHQYFNKLVAETMAATGKTRQETEEIERHNLAYYAGYFDIETRQRVESLFNCEHPFFGRASDGINLTPEEIFKMGQQWGERSDKIGPEAAMQEIFQKNAVRRLDRSVDQVLAKLPDRCDMDIDIKPEDDIFL